MLKKFIKNDVARGIVEWLLTVLIAALIGFFVINFVVRTAKVHKDSMVPTLMDGDTVVVNRLSYLFGSPKRGHIIAFIYKEDRTKNYVKRVIGLPGDVIDYDWAEMALYINGEKYIDEYSEYGVEYGGTISYPLTVPDGCWFVLGDNRINSEDSRYTEVGCIPKSEIIGRVVFRIRPLGKIGFVH